MACVAAPARENETNSQLDSERALNSEAIVGWVASTSDASTFAVNVPMMRTVVILKTVDEVSNWPCSVAS